jgi:alpha-tubulin suppressor-like RCC1 family protein
MKFLVSTSRGTVALPAVLASLVLAGCASGAAARPFDEATSGGAGGASSTGSGFSAGVGGGAAVVPLQATAVAVGAAHSCALLVDGTVACWGDGSLGQLGDGTSGAGNHRAEAVRVPGVTGATLLRAGDDTTCAVVPSGVLCWGDGAYGQLGDGVAGDGYFQAMPVAVHGLESVADLTVRGSAACAALPDGSVRCWGLNSKQAWLGFSSNDCGPYVMQGSNVAEPCEKTPRGVPDVAGAGTVTTSGQHSCDIAADSSVSCWGADDFGQLGDGNSGPNVASPAPVQVDGVGKAIQLALGTSHTCALTGDKRIVMCWGDNALGQLGIGSEGLDSYQTKPGAVLGIEHAVDLDAAGDVTCAVLSDHSVRCWGDASQLLAPTAATATAALLPTAAPGVSSVVQVRTSGQHACALRVDATVVCWGLNDRGQVGDGMMSLGDDSLAPVAPPS